MQGTISELPKDKKELTEENQQQRESAWFFTLLSNEKEYTFTKNEFLRPFGDKMWPTHIWLWFTYGFGVKHSPQQSISCKNDDFMTVGHRNLCNITALLVSRCTNTMM